LGTRLSVGQFTKLTQDVLNKHCTPKRVHKRLPTNFPSNCWFDAECNDSKRKISNLTKEMAAQPNDHLKQDMYWRTKAAHKKLIKQKKRKAIEDLPKELETAR